MNTTLKLMLIAIEVLAINEDGSANINFAYSEPNSAGKPKKWHRFEMNGIFITGRAKKNLFDDNNIKYKFNQTYVSVNNSRNASENPFCLMRKHTTDSEGNSCPTYYLKCVEENGSYIQSKTMPNGDVISHRVWKDNKPDYAFIRYEDQYDAQKKHHEKAIAEVAESVA